MNRAAAIDFLALLAYPESEPRRDRATAAMTAYCARMEQKTGDRRPLGKAMPVQQMQNQLRQLNRRLLKRLVAAHDCVRLELGATYEGADGRSLSLNDVAADHAAYRQGQGYERYKSDWWAPEVMHLGIFVHGLQITGGSTRALTAQELLQAPHWIERAEELSAYIAVELRTHSSPALRGFKTTQFLFPSHP
jgi:hypothetical protein